MNLQDHLPDWKTFPLFRNVSPDTAEYASAHAGIYSCQKGDLFHTDECALFFILKGSASVLGGTKGKPVILNTLKEGKVFGMASLFGASCRTTSIVAREDCVYALLTQEQIEEIMKRDIVFTRNYVTFLSDKIRFLNRKISFFTSGTAEKKLAGYLLSLPLEGDLVKLDTSLSRLASTLDMGRASLYRALDSLEENGFLTRCGKEIRIISPEEFKRIYGESL